MTGATGVMSPKSRPVGDYLQYRSPKAQERCIGGTFDHLNPYLGRLETA